MSAAVWLVIGLLLCAAELLTLDLVLLMLGTAALVTAGAALVTASLPLQLVVLAGSAGALLVLVRPVARRHLAVAALPSGRDRLRGRTVTVVQEVADDSGQVRLDGELWRARPYAGGPRVGRPARGRRPHRRGRRRRGRHPVRLPRGDRVTGTIVALVLVALLLLLVVRTVRIVPQASVFVIERLGRYSRTLDPGIHLLVPVLDKVRVKVDIREQVVGFPPQSVITRDNLVVGIDTVIYYSPTDVAAATYQIEDYVAAIEQLVVTTLRNVVGGLALEEALTGRDHINSQLATVLDEATGKWGIKVNRVEIRGIEPPATIRDAMEQAMRADRGKRAAILTAEGQQQSAVLSAQGEKQAAVLRAEAAQQATVLAAEGDKQSRVLRAEGEALAIARVVQAIKAADVDETVLAYQQLQLLPRLAEGSANKVWFVPTDVAGHLETARRLLGGPAGDQR